MSKTVKLEDVVSMGQVFGTIQDEINLVRGNVTIETALMLARMCVKRAALPGIAALVTQDIQDMYDMHVMLYGELPEDARLYQIEPWVAPLEQEFMNYMDEYRSVLSSHWLGTTDTKTPRYDKEIEVIANNFAEEVYKNITYIHDNEDPREKTDAQVLSAVGILRPHIEALIVNRKPVEKPEAKEEVKDMQYNLQEVITALHEYTGMMGVIGKPLHDLLDNAADEDTGLAYSGLHALGLPQEPGNVFVMRDIKAKHGMAAFTKMVESGQAVAQVAPPPALAKVFDPNNPQEGDITKTADGKDIIFQNGAWAFYTVPVATLPEPAPPAPLPPPTEPVAQYAEAVDGASGKAIRRLLPDGAWEFVPEAPATPAAAPVATPPAAPTVTAGNIPAMALKAVKEYTSMKGEDLGGGLGVSRATFDNYAKGKVVLPATEEHKAFLLKVIDDHISNLTVARNQVASS